MTVSERLRRERSKTAVGAQCTRKSSTNARSKGRRLGCAVPKAALRSTSSVWHTCRAVGESARAPGKGRSREVSVVGTVGTSDHSVDVLDASTHIPLVVLDTWR